MNTHELPYEIAYIMQKKINNFFPINNEVFFMMPCVLCLHDVRFLTREMSVKQLAILGLIENSADYDILNY